MNSPHNDTAVFNLALIMRAETRDATKRGLSSGEPHGSAEGHRLSPRASELSAEDSSRRDSRQRNSGCNGNVQSSFPVPESYQKESEGPVLPL